MKHRNIVAAPLAGKHQVCIDYGPPGAGELGLSLAWDLSERHAKALAKAINDLLAKTEDELCPPSCHRCGCPGSRRPLVRYKIESDGAMSSTGHLWCGSCVDAIRADASKFANK